LQRPGRGPDIEPGPGADRGDVGRAQHEGREDGAPVGVGEEPDQFPSGEGRHRHAN
jgi:hypothetical protein